MYYIFNVNILNPTIWVGELEFREPITSLTDFLTALVCGVAFFSLSKKLKKVKSNEGVFLKFYFLCFFIGMTSAAFLGHAFQAYFEWEYKIIGWVFSALGQLLLALGTLLLMKDFLKHKFYTTIYYLLIMQFIIFIFLLIHPSYSDFKIAQVASSAVLIGVILPLHIFHFYKTKSSGSKYVISAIGYALIPAYIYNNQISVNQWFNYHDISHVLMAVYMFIMYIGLSKLIAAKSSILI